MFADVAWNAHQMMETFREREKLPLINTRKSKKAAQENKQYTNKVKLTSQLHDIGDLWISQQYIVLYKSKVDNQD